MDKIDCHSSTPKEELVEFVNKHKGKKIEIHYETNIGVGWDDDFFTYDTSGEKHYNEILDTIKTSYIHGIKCVR